MWVASWRSIRGPPPNRGRGPALASPGGCRARMKHPVPRQTTRRLPKPVPARRASDPALRAGRPRPRLPTAVTLGRAACGSPQTATWQRKALISCWMGARGACAEEEERRAKAPRRRQAPHVEDEAPNAPTSRAAASETLHWLKTRPAPAEVPRGRYPPKSGMKCSDKPNRLPKRLVRPAPAEVPRGLLAAAAPLVSS